MKCLFAPMEGITDSVFRRAHAAVFGGAEEYYIPFIRLTASHSLTGREMRETDPEENAGIPAVPQVLTRDPEVFCWAAGYLKDRGYPRIDLNLGCPAPTVVSRGRGSAMLRDPKALGLFFDRVFASCPLPVSVKTRIGFSSPEESGNILALLSVYPFERVVIHPRTTAEQYAGTPHLEVFAEAAGRFGGRAVYNGDLFGPEAVRAFEKACPGQERVMIGRGLIRNPALGRVLQGGEKASGAEIRAFLDRLYADWRQRFGNPVALGRMKKLLHLMCEGMDDAHRLQKAVKKAAFEERYLEAREAVIRAWTAEYGRE